MLDLVGAVALLLWGLRMVKTGVSRAFGARLRRWIAAGTRNRVTAFGIGLAVTMALQSSTGYGSADGIVRRQRLRQFGDGTSPHARRQRRNGPSGVHPCFRHSLARTSIGRYRLCHVQLQRSQTEQGNRTNCVGTGTDSSVHVLKCTAARLHGTVSVCAACGAVADGEPILVDISAPLRPSGPEG